MLHSHYDWADYYDIVSSGLEYDVEFYLNLAREVKGGILELGCGTGRITLPVSRLGQETVGLDLSAAMLEKAHWKAKLARVGENLRFVEGDMRTFQLSQTFSLIMIPYRSFLHLLTVKDQMETLKQIYNHLELDGLLALNIFVPQIKHLYEEDEKTSTRGIYEIPGSEDHLVVWDYTRFDHFMQISEVIRQYERVNAQGEVCKRVVVPLHIRYVFPLEMHHLLERAGFSIVHQYGDFVGTPFGPESNELVIVARKG